MRYMFVIAATGLIAACQTASAPAAAHYRLVDLTGRYAALYDRTQGQPAKARVAAFKAVIVPFFPAFYRYGRPGAPDTAERYDERVAMSFDQFAGLREPFTRAANGFSAMLKPSIREFQKTFADATEFGDIYLVHSLGEMDGGTREVDGTVYFVFGADVIARLHPPGTERPFFQHELFHRYQSRWFEECEQIWCGVWTEGTAVLVAAELNPATDDAQLLLTQPEPIRSQVEANLKEAVCAVRARLDSSQAADWSALFSSDRLNARLPPRFGYYVGYRVAREIRLTHSIQEMAKIGRSEVRPMLEAALAQLANCAGS